MNDANFLSMRAEHLAEIAQEAETKKKANDIWREYRSVMIRLTGDKNMFRRKPSPTGRPSRALIRTLVSCKCGNERLFQWRRKPYKYVMDCGHDDSYIGEMRNGLEVRRCQCGVESKPQRTGETVQFSCSSCGNSTGWHYSNSEARNEWNALQKESLIIERGGGVRVSIFG